MTDRELLEWAAKAAGYAGLFWSERDGTFYDSSYNEDAESNADAIWNPLCDDGDALRLAVKLKMRVREGEAVLSCGSRYRSDEADPYAATRRAIVRAAAAIGQSLAATSSGDSR